MHLLSAEIAGRDDLDEAIDLDQSPAEIVILSAADTELACLAEARHRLGPLAPTLRLASLLQLSHPMSVDLHIEKTVSKARIVLVRLLGGKSYWSYGLEQLELTCDAVGAKLIAIPGDDKEDEELKRACNVDDEIWRRCWRYLIHGGIDNASMCLSYLGTLLDRDLPWVEPRPLLNAGIYKPGCTEPSISDLRQNWSRPRAAIIFYRALFQSGQLEVIDMLVQALDDAGLDALPLYANSLKDPSTAHIIEELLIEADVSIVLNATGFAIGKRPTILEATSAPVLQIVMSGGSEEAWRNQACGLSPRDLAMNVVLPEMDGRVMSRAISFKGNSVLDEECEIRLTRYVPVVDRIAFTATLAANWVRLRDKKPASRKIVLVLANYPTRDGRIANGVGLDTPESAISILKALEAAGYSLSNTPDHGNALIEALQKGVTNATSKDRDVRAQLDHQAYAAMLDQLPNSACASLLKQWGPAPNKDIPIAVLEFDHIAIAIQPARGYDKDPSKTYHSPDLIPPHEYLAFYHWIRNSFQADAVIHVGKHGNMEWLPGKALALSEHCWPEIVFGPLPHFYPFIVNDPGEGSQAKRRAQAVIIDHLTPPMTRAENYGDLIELERLVDEYFDAANLDPRRTTILRKRILDETCRLGLDRDLGFDDAPGETERLEALDNHLCEIKELQIRDGLHVLGQSPSGELRTNLLRALLRLPRGVDAGKTASLHRAMARDLGLAFDPLDCVMSDPWSSIRPDILQSIDESHWRTAGDTVERIEILASAMIGGAIDCPKSMVETNAVLSDAERLQHLLDCSGDQEIRALLNGLDGRFVEPGPSGAPTRGKPDVLPTGRNFYSIDSRALPTQTAWDLGWKSASRVIDLYTQTHGDWPKTIALSAWGTSNMRTGGDDLAQALALMGARPVWDQTSGRVTGVEILPASVLGRPRVDVTLRVSGFFRDAFPAQIELLDDAVRQIADLDEEETINPLAAAARREAQSLKAKGVDPARASRLASSRIFGARPGAYGAGLQALIDGGDWQDEAELAEAFMAWGSFAYGRKLDGEVLPEQLKTRLGGIDLVLHNQDNREHDILDSDDYYQFEGGLAATIRHLSGQNPEIYHNDHSRPESPKIRPLKQEIGMIVRGRAANPKWIAGVMRHGYKGAFEMAASLDYLFAFAATTRLVDDHHFDQLYDAYLGDEQVRAFIKDNNPAALVEMAQKFDEAIRRGFWQPGRNSVRHTLDACYAKSASNEE